MNEDANKVYCKVIFFSNFRFLLKAVCKVTLSTSNSECTEYVTKRIMQEIFVQLSQAALDLFSNTPRNMFMQILNLSMMEMVWNTQKGIESRLLKLLGKRIVYSYMVYVALKILYRLCRLCLDLLLVLLNNNRHLKDIKVKRS